MISKFYIEDTYENAKALTALEKSIPCFIDYDLLDDGFLNCTIEYREEDRKAVEEVIGK